MAVPISQAWRCAVVRLDANSPKHVVASGRGREVRISATSASTAVEEEVEFEYGENRYPMFTGNDPLARFVSSMIAIKPVYAVLTFGARTIMKRTAEKSGIPWKKMVEDLKKSDVYAEKDLLEKVDIPYPDYYTQKFHGYDEGNLSWEAAFDVEAATLSLSKRVFPEINPAEKALEAFRCKWLQKIESHHAQFSNARQPSAILDVGCSTGISTRFLRDYFPEAQVTGLDLSPYFLAVGQFVEKQMVKTGSVTKKPIQYVHANAENSGLPSDSFDVISFAAIIHECPRGAVSNFLREARRLLKTGGTISFTEQAPTSKVFQKLPPALFILMKSTEPWIDEYYMLNLPDELEKNGFSNISSVLTTPRHFTLTATAV